MQLLNNMLAEMTEKTAQQIDKIYHCVENFPNPGFRVMFVLTIVIAVAVVLIFQRQKKIAQNQVDLGKLLAQLLEK